MELFLVGSQVVQKTENVVVVAVVVVVVVI